MSITWQIEADNLVVFRVSGRLRINEFLHVQEEMGTAIADLGRVSVLILLEDFDGWEDAAGWGDVSYLERNDPYIRKMAIVGEEKWRDKIYMFTLKGLRPVPIEYFTPDAQSQARTWLRVEEG